MPDETFRRASERAAQLGMSRSEFFTRAAVDYLDHLDDESITQQVDAALTLSSDDGSARDAVRQGRHRLAAGDDEW